METPLLKAIELAGGQTALAKRCGVRQQSVQLWLKNGVPPKRVIAIEHAVNGAVTRYDLRPDIYPRESLGAAAQEEHRNGS